MGAQCENRKIEKYYSFISVAAAAAFEWSSLEMTAVHSAQAEMYIMTTIFRQHKQQSTPVVIRQQQNERRERRKRERKI